MFAVVCNYYCLRFVKHSTSAGEHVVRNARAYVMMIASTGSQAATARERRPTVHTRVVVAKPATA